MGRVCACEEGNAGHSGQKGWLKSVGGTTVICSTIRMSLWSESGFCEESFERGLGEKLWNQILEDPQYPLKDIREIEFSCAVWENWFSSCHQSPVAVSSWHSKLTQGFYRLLLCDVVVSMASFGFGEQDFDLIFKYQWTERSIYLQKTTTKNKNKQKNLPVFRSA